MKKFVLIGCLLSAVSLTAMAQNENYAKEISTGYKGPVIQGLKAVKKSLNFCVIGDWGRYGAYYQKAVAEQLSSAMVGVGGDFILSTGDNFYPKGVLNEYDPIFKYSYEDVYNTLYTHADWYVSLGNHDYKTNPDGEVAYTKVSGRWHMPARYFSFVKSAKKDPATSVEFFVLDTSPFQKDYYSDDEYAAHVKGVDTAAQKRWLENALKNSKAKWKVVVGHHPLYTVGTRMGKTQDMLNSFKSLFEKYHVDAYFCGHEHHLEHDAPADVHFVQCLSGSGSEATAVSSAPYATFAKQDFGFCAVSITEKEMSFQYVNWEGKVLYVTSVLKK